MAVTNREIFDNALALIGEDVESEYVEDYEERAPYLIASVCSQNIALDKKIRTIDKLEEAQPFSPVYLSLELFFPLCDKLISCGALYVASMLVIDEDPDLSDTLYDKYCDSVSSLSGYYSSVESSGTSPDGAPTATCHPIKDIYFFN